VKSFFVLISVHNSTAALQSDLTSVKISHNSRYALINLAPDVSSVILDWGSFFSDARGLSGTSTLGSTYGSRCSQVHGAEAGSSCYQKLFWWSGWTFCRQRE